jgi:hypothetical protein
VAAGGGAALTAEEPLAGRVIAVVATAAAVELRWRPSRGLTAAVLVEPWPQVWLATADLRSEHKYVWITWVASENITKV